MSKFGSNVGYVDEMYARYLEDPASVGDVWREFFADYKPGAPVPVLPRPAKVDDGRSGASTSGPATPAVARPDDGPAPEPLRGIAAKIVENMTTSLEVPTATSVRSIPVKLLEENRRVINDHQATVSGAKVSFTHLIAWGVVRALEKHPGMNVGYEDRAGVPHRRVRPKIHLGLAIDIQRNDQRVLLVPNIKDAAAHDFPSFVARYDDLVARARSNQLAVADFQDTTVTLTNPGMLGTAMSVPRLMSGQGTILGVGNIGYPAEYTGMAAEVISALGISKIMTVTSTYDHRVIQGAESGAFLKTLESLFLGADRFYERIFHELGVPHEPLLWSGDLNPQVFGGADSTEIYEKQASVVRLIRAHRVRGHLWADLDPLGYAPQPHEELELSTYGLSVWDLDRRFVAADLAGGSRGMRTLREILDTLRATYCRHIGVEFLHIPEPEPRAWLQERMERTRNQEPIDFESQKQILRKLNAAEAFERFLHTTYLGHKRFSLEGAETLIPMLDALLTDSAHAGFEQAFVGMAHRGRLNVLANVIGMSYDRIFRKFEGDLDPESVQGSGDVIYHLGFDGEHVAPDGARLRLTLASNPSHLEAVDPVVEGMTRAWQDRSGDVDRARALPILIHGDAAFAGQGVVAETLNLSQLRGYRTGGTVHIVVNNQIGFTTGPADARSSLYSSDVAKAVRAPIFHVNGDYPEDAVRVVKLALEFRRRFQRDVVVDMVCYRRWGHNETDDPSYTHPTLYAKIENHRSVRKLYTEQLLRRGDLDPETAERALEDFRERLRAVHEQVKAVRSLPVTAPDDDEDVRGSAPESATATAAAPAILDAVLDGLERLPEGFEPQPKLARQLARRRGRYADGTIDWALAEALALGSLCLEGTSVRLSGEDSGRGTFSQRHAVLHDHRTGEAYTPLAHLSSDQGSFSVYDSLLSEFAVLGFEYGFSVQWPEALVLWEAQFGDFSNGAQVIIDQFLASSEEKWGEHSGVVLLLPHGSEGQGPEHSSARLERFLQLCAAGNLQVVFPSTPAQYFHLLRRQVRQQPVRPLVVMTPKSLLRHKDCVSTAEDLGTGRFHAVLDDPRFADGRPARRVAMCSGKVYYDLLAHAREQGIDDVALVRVEQFYPFPARRLHEIARRYTGAEFVWVQEEPRNMGAWSFMAERLAPILADSGAALSYVGRPRAAAPASGSMKRHQAAQDRLVGEALAGASPAPPAASEAASTGPGGRA